MIREARDANFCNRLDSNSSNSRSMLSTVNDMLSRKPSNELETSYCIDGHETNDELEIATGFNQYFANARKKFASAFQKTSLANCFLDYLGSRTDTQYNVEPINEYSLLAVMKLIENTSPGNDKIPIFIYKEYFQQIGGVMTHICKKN